MIDFTALKAIARERMSQSHPPYWLVMLVWFLASVLVPNILTIFAPNPLTNYSTLVAEGIDPMVAMGVFAGSAATVGLFLAIVISLYQMVLSFGTDNYALKLYRGETCGYGSIFEGFSLVWKVIATQLLTALFMIGWALLLAIPFALVVGLCVNFLPGLSVPLVLVAYIAYMVGFLLISFRYALVNLALADEPELGATRAIRRSKELMQGSCGTYFRLMLSFLGWLILCSLLSIIVALLEINSAVSFLMLPDAISSLSSSSVVFPLLGALAGLPVYLWLNPYIALTRAGFYETLSDEKPKFDPLDEFSRY